MKLDEYLLNSKLKKFAQFHFLENVCTRELGIAHCTLNRQVGYDGLCILKILKVLLRVSSSGVFYRRLDIQLWDQYDLAFCTFSIVQEYIQIFEHEKQMKLIILNYHLVHFKPWEVPKASSPDFQNKKRGHYLGNNIINNII